MNDIFKEAQEEYRQEQLLRFWHRHAKTIIGILILALMGAGASSYWQSKRLEKKQEETYAFAQAALSASEQGPAAAGAAYGAILPQLSGSRLIAARLAHANATGMSGDVAAAIREYDDVATSKEASASERDLAEISSIGLQLDTGDPAALSARLNKLAGDTSAWRYTAHEFQALLAYRQGDKQKAFDIAAPLAKESGAPDGVHTMAAQIAAIASEGQPMPAVATIEAKPVSTPTTGPK